MRCLPALVHNYTSFRQWINITIVQIVRKCKCLYNTSPQYNKKIFSMVELSKYFLKKKRIRVVDQCFISNFVSGWSRAPIHSCRKQIQSWSIHVANKYRVSLLMSQTNTELLFLFNEIMFTKYENRQLCIDMQLFQLRGHPKRTHAHPGQRELGYWTKFASHYAPKSSTY